MHKLWLPLIGDCDKIKTAGQEIIFALRCSLPYCKPGDSLRTSKTTVFHVKCNYTVEEFSYMLI